MIRETLPVQALAYGTLATIVVAGVFDGGLCTIVQIVGGALAGALVSLIIPLGVLR